MERDKNIETNDIKETPDDYELMDIDMEEVERMSRESKKRVEYMLENQRKKYSYELVSTYNLSMTQILKMIFSRITEKITKNIKSNVTEHNGK